MRVASGHRRPQTSPHAPLQERLRQEHTQARRVRRVQGQRGRLHRDRSGAEAQRQGLQGMRWPELEAPSGATLLVRRRIFRRPKHEASLTNLPRRAKHHGVLPHSVRYVIVTSRAPAPRSIQPIDRASLSLWWRMRRSGERDKRKLGGCHMGGRAKSYVEKGCNVAGCDGSHLAVGLCVSHYRRLTSYKAALRSRS